MSETLGFISFVPWTFIAMIANVYILYRIVRHFLFKPVREIMEKRQREVDTIYAEADRSKAEAEYSKDQYHKKLDTADTQAQAVITSALDTARKQEAEILARARGKAQHLLVKAEGDIEQMQRKAVIGLQDDIAQMSLDIARKVIEKEIQETDHQALIEESINRFRENIV